MRTAFLISKFIFDFGLGFVFTLGHMMVSEITPVVLRGISTAGTKLGIAVGQLPSNAAIVGFGSYTDRCVYPEPFAF